MSNTFLEFGAIGVYFDQFGPTSLEKIDSSVHDWQLLAEKVSLSFMQFFYNLQHAVKEKQIKRIMEESLASFNHDVTARKYIDLYERMLQRPLINREFRGNSLVTPFIL